ncbi:MAG: TonB-dependent receptor [Tannerella sp.]|jgi:TonB-linked SusC/RagA family outer membrane protein|nr:TonB-dependent receptor [Tannerella sp.]
MINRLIDGMKNAKLKKLVHVMTLSAFLLMMGVWTTNARGSDSSETLEPQQSRIQITGTIVDQTGEPVIGVNIVEKGATANGTVTDMDGKFSLAVSPEATLVVSYIGYVTQDIAVGNRTQLQIILQEDLQTLEEVVVVGYGTQKKVNLTGSVSNVNFESEVIAARPLTSVSSALSGLSSGLVVRQSSGTPSSDNASLRVRGIGTLNNSDPLILIDGQPGDINSLSPGDISSVSILKDAASSAIYGSRAANGVILVTTKSGSDSGGKVTFNYTGSVGSSQPTKLFDVISNTADHMTLVNQVDRNSNRTPSFTQERIDEWREKSKTDPLLYPNTDWWDAVLTPDMIQNHSFSARGGSSKIGFYTSFDYLDNQGLMANTGYKRYTFRNNLAYQVNDWLKLGNILTAMFGSAEPAGPNGVFQWWPATTPGLLPRHPDGRYGGAMTGGNESAANNVLMSLENAMGENMRQRYTGKIYAVLTPVKGLNITGSYFIDMYNYDAWSSNRPASRWNFQTETEMFTPSGVLGISNSYSKTARYVTDIYADYSKTFANVHDLHVLAGFNQEYYKSNSFSASKQDLYSLDTPVLDAAPTNVSSGGTASDFAMRSFFGRLNYEYAHKYLFEANLRADGSSRFAPASRWGVFPSFSAGWRISEEAFWGSLHNTVDYLKLRTSWGQLGNNSIGNYDWQDVYAAANYSFNGTVVKGLAPGAIANDRMSWETVNAFNLGIDAGLFRKVSLSLEYYDKLTHGILYRNPIPYVNGGLTAPMLNSAKVRNSGFEGDISYRTSIGRDFVLAVGFNGSVNHNKIVQYKGDLLEAHGVGVWTEGQPIDKFYVREIDHIVQDKAEIDQLVADGWTFSPVTPGPGDFLYKDRNGDKKINDDDRVLKGNPFPVFTYGGNLSAEYRGFDFYTLITGVSGWDKYTAAAFFSFNVTPGYLFNTKYMDSWTETNHSTTIPKIYISDARNQQTSAYHLHDASYFRVKTLQLGYTVPPRITQSIKIDKIRVYVNLENFFIFTSYPGMDPETTSSSNSADVNYPLMKTVSCGLNVNF